MAEVVDAIVADLVLKGLDQYEAGFNRATAAHDRFSKSVPRIGGFDGIKGVDAQQAQQYVDRHTKAANDVARAEDGATVKIAATRKKRADTSIAADKAEVDSAKKAAADKVAAEEAAQARISAMVERGLARKRAAIVPGTGRMNTSGAVVQPGDRVAPISIPASALAGGSGAAAEVAAETEVNHLLAEQATLQGALTFASGKDRDIIRDKLAELRLIKQLQTAGLDDAAIAIKLDERALAIEAERAAVAGKQTKANALRFAEGAGLGRNYGGIATVGGIVTAAGIALVAEAAKKGLDYAQSLKQDSEQIGLTTRDLQLYQHAALEAGVSTDQLQSAFSTLSANIGKAQGGDKQLNKVFGLNGLNIDLGNAKDGFKSLSDILPTFSDRLSKIPDQTKRFALETAAGGESLRKLDPILSQGSASFDTWSQSIEAAGGVLSDSDIQKSDQTAKKISLLNDQLQRDLASTVANNADSILGLAKAFLALADGALKAFSAVSNANALFSLNHPTLTAIGNFGTGKSVDQSDREYRQQLLGNSSGRQALLHRNTNAINELSQGSRGQGLNDDLPGFYDVGITGGLADNPKARQDARQKLLTFRRQIEQEDARANAPAPAPKVQPGTPGNGNVFAPDPRKPRGKSAETLAREAEERTKRFNDAISQFQDEQLRSQESMTGDINKRADIEKELADRALAKQVADIDSEAKQNVLKGADPGVEEARAKQLKAEAQNAHDNQVAGINQQRGFDLAKAQNDVAERILQQQGEHLNNELALADTSAKRRQIELQLLANAEAQERVRLEGVVKTNPADSPATADANAQLKTLGARYDDQRAGVIRETETSLDAYKRTLKATSDSISEFGVSVLQDFNTGLDQSIDKALHLHGVFGQIIGDLIDMAIKQELISPIANSGGFGSILGSIGKLFGASGGASADTFGTSFSDVLSGVSSFGGGKASGGPVDPSKVYMVGESGRELFVPGTAGTIVPNHAIAPMNQRVASPQQAAAPTQIVLHVQSNDYFDAKVHSISSAVAADTSVRVVRAAAPGIAQMGAQASPAVIQRQQKLGG